MKITEEVREAILKKCQEESGGARKLAQAAGFTPAQINRYHSGKTRTMTEECWTRLFQHVMRYLPDGFTCKVLVDGRPETRIVRQRSGEKLISRWENREYSRLFGSSLPTRGKIEALLAGKIRACENEMSLLVLLLNFDAVMAQLTADPSAEGPENPCSGGRPEN